MKKVISLSLALASSVAMAADFKTNIESRVDMNLKKSEVIAQNGSTAVIQKTNNFQLIMLRLNLFGNINDTLSYRVRYRITTAPTATERDSSNNALDFLYLDHKNSLFTLRVGKQNWGEAYGRESMISSSDLIATSAVYALYNESTLSLNNAYRFGISTLFKFNEHNLTFAISNPSKNYNPQYSATANISNNSLAYGVYYNSVLMDKMFQPLAGYTVLPVDPAFGGRGNGASRLYAIGFRSEVAGVTVDADYKILNVNNLQSINGRAERTESKYISAMYGKEQIIPFFQYIHDLYSKQGSTGSDYKKDTFGLGVAYRPYTDLNFRYHVAYVRSLKNYTVSNASFLDKEKSANLVIGFKADI